MESIKSTAVRHGVAAHVLRHWEEVGLLQPDRTVSGHRRFGRDHDARIELIQCAKAAGLSLDQIRLMLSGSPQGRRLLLKRHAERLERQAAEIDAARRLVAHVSECDAQACEVCAVPYESFGFPRPVEPV